MAGKGMAEDKGICQRKQGKKGILEKLPDKWKYYLAQEIGIEFKACLYFFCILFFYSTYRVIGGRYEASILHMLEMILCTYFMGYLQVLLLSNFDEADRLGVREILYSVLCSGIYTAAATLFGWFDRNVVATGCFVIFIETAYICAFLVYKVKREVDTRVLNEELKAFQERRAE